MAIETNVFVTQFDAISDIREPAVLRSQPDKRSGGIICSLHFNGDKRLDITNKEIHPHSRFVIPIEIEVITLFDQHITHHIPINCTFICAVVPVHPHILLRLFIKRSNEQACIFIIEFIGFRIVVAFQRE